MFKNFPVAPLVGAIAIACASTATFADQTDSQDVVVLDPIVVTASKIATKASDVPARITVISQDEIQKNPALNLNNLVKQEAALNTVQSGGRGQTASIFTRGTNSNHTLVLKDGAALTEGINGKNNTELLDLSDVSQIEILKGPASVQYGSDAIGGVIQLLTDTPDRNSAFLTGLYGENNTYKAIIGADLFQNGFYAQIRGQRLESDGSQVLNTQDEDEKAAYDQKGYSAKVGYIQDNLNTSVSISENQGVNQYLDFTAGTNTAKRDFKNQLVNWLGQYQINDALKINARYSNYQDQATYIETYSNAYDSERNEGDINLNWTFSPTQNVLLGVSTQDTDVTYDYLDGEQSLGSTGYYLQHQYNGERVHTQAGVRLEDEDQFGQHTVGQVAGRFQIAPLTSIYANIGTAFKAPTAYQLYAAGYGNPDLKPEESVSYELGLDQKLNHGLSTGLSIYQTKVKNLISNECVATCNGDWVTTFPVYKNINNDKSTFTGGEVYLNWQMQEFFVKTAYHHVKAEYDHSSKEVLRRPRQSLSLSAGWDNGEYGISASAIAKSRSKDFADWPSTTPNINPGYVTTNVNAYWQPIPMIKLFTNIENIGDVQYKTAYNGNGIYYVNGGRLASIGATLRY